jgi:hypothetical protein
LRGKDPVRIKIVISERILGKILNFNYLDFYMGLNREIGININYKDFNKYVEQLKGLQPEKLGRRHYSGSIRLWQYQLFCMAQNVGL